MVDLFQWDDISKTIRVNSGELFLVKEFAKLLEEERNINEFDKTGERKERAFREFAYMYLMLNYKSAYADYSEQERHVAALEDASLTDEEFNDLDFRAACRKYAKLQDSSRGLQLIKSALGMVDKLNIYFRNVDLSERDLLTGKPIYKAKDVMAEMASVSKVLEELRMLEVQFKKEVDAPKAIRAGATEGYDPRKVRR